ncbi:hypothetical protein HG531_002142 [Fusarium graminearum]|nr:hypothetical protein HG531_002142 [Fusarium graminearum]
MFSSVATTARRASATWRCVSAEGSVGWRCEAGGDDCCAAEGICAWAWAWATDGDAIVGGGDVGGQGDNEEDDDDEEPVAAAEEAGCCEEVAAADMMNINKSLFCQLSLK